MYIQPATLEEAIESLAVPGRHLVAGGTDFYPALGDRLPESDVVDLTRVQGLRGIMACPKGIEIGAATTWSDLLRTDLPPIFDGLKAAAREVGSVQIQNSGTLVGNICNASPAADGVPPLMTLNAEVAILGPRGVRRIPLGTFLRGPRKTALAKGELVTSICIRAQPEGTQSAFLKLGSRKYLVISIAMVAVALRVAGGRLRDVRISVGACSAVARRLAALEASLEGASVQSIEKPELVQDRHLMDLTPLSDVRGSADYRLDAVRTLIRRALAQAVAKAGG